MTREGSSTFSMRLLAPGFAVAVLSPALFGSLPASRGWGFTCVRCAGGRQSRAAKPCRVLPASMRSAARLVRMTCPAFVRLYTFPSQLVSVPNLASHICQTELQAQDAATAPRGCFQDAVVPQGSCRGSSARRPACSPAAASLPNCLCSHSSAPRFHFAKRSEWAPNPLVYGSRHGARDNVVLKDLKCRVLENAVISGFCSL